MLIAKGDLCKKVSCWERVGKWSSGERKEELWGRQASTRHVGGLPSTAVGRDRRLRMDTSRFELLAHAHLHCIELCAAKQECAPSPISRSTHLLTKPKSNFSTQSLYGFFLGTIQTGVWKWNIVILHWGQRKEGWIHHWIEAWRDKWEEKRILHFLEPCSPSVVHRPAAFHLGAS